MPVLDRRTLSPIEPTQEAVDDLEQRLNFIETKIIPEYAEKLQGNRYMKHP
ncbi:hypothetical protein OP10G_4099 [Fimbriimonas ginsengisoli Gsoil 348]|uniref:Uncharacterized protein n=2 Tax=Fimbriimonas ginsengisoli TaxID=1005039 RepID=A0A068NVS4_FIMGI|nr:hypothetical protein OP10G_4099 [Fimbriimonas ginsengisoli Gsoil 348]